MLTVIALTVNTRNPIGRGIGFQAHSYNDMRSWHQLFLKGATHVKIDPNYRSQEFCADQLRVRNKTDPRGCFVLNHDTPTLLPPNFRRGYNTTDDVLAVLQDRDGPLYTFLTRPSVRIYFALCFKSIPLNVCAQKSSAAKHWRSLVDQLVSRFLELRSRDPALNVEFVLDSGVPQRCFLQRWRPLVGTSSPFPEQVPMIPCQLILWFCTCLMSSRSTGFNRDTISSPPTSHLPNFNRRLSRRTTPRSATTAGACSMPTGQPVSCSVTPRRSGENSPRPRELCRWIYMHAF